MNDMSLDYRESAELGWSPLDVAVEARDREVLSMVKRSVETGNVMLAFQPVVRARAGNDVAFHEGLMRILDETGRVIPAREFILSVETLPLGRKIDCLALSMGLDSLAAAPDLRLSVNMSARSIGHPAWRRILAEGLAQDSSIAQRLILEITESSAMGLPDLVLGFMADLQSHGVTFALDDFGAGHTSFRYLRDFYFDMIKIDGQFIRGIARNPDNQVLAAALHAIAQHFELFTVAEAVETEEDALYLTELGIDCLQGYYFGAPTIHPPWGPPRPGYP